MLKPNKDVLRDKDVTLKSRRRNCGDGHPQPGFPRYSRLAPVRQAGQTSLKYNTGCDIC